MLFTMQPARNPAKHQWDCHETEGQAKQSMGKTQRIGHGMVHVCESKPKLDDLLLKHLHKMCVVSSVSYSVTNLAV